ncbi:MAG: AAA family ATPase [Aeromicrobium sp.]|nr:AAA family ATPase [Burkholderiales bacterium]
MTSTPGAVPMSSTNVEKIAEASQVLQAMQQQMSAAVIGQDAIISQVLIGLVAGGHVLIEGVPGLGKTLLVKALAKTFDGNFSRIQFTPDLMPSDITGHTLFDAKSGEFRTRQGPVFTNLLLADEINRAPAKTQSALLEVMQETQVTIEGHQYPLSMPFMVLATQNPIEQEGTYPLPEAQLDRFLLKIRIDYPTVEDEAAMVRAVTAMSVADKLDVDKVMTLVKPDTIIRLQQVAAAIMVEDSVLDYAVRLTRATRDFPLLAAGAGPRGAISLIRAARAHAMAANRGFVTPDDIKDVSLAVMRHRVRASPEMEIEGRDVDYVLSELFSQVEAPRV